MARRSAASPPGAGSSPAPGGPQPTDRILQLSGITKTFAGTRALDDVSLDVGPREIHALVGANGSGKSTLIKILAGYHQPDASPPPTFIYQGRPIAFPMRPSLPHSLGMRFLHQDLALIDTLTISENIALTTGYPTARAGRIDWRTHWQQASDAMALVGLERSPKATVDQLTTVERVLTALARVVADSAKITLLVLDEVTAQLPHAEVETVHAAVRKVIADTGAGVIYVSHRIEELFALSTRMTVLRDGRSVAQLRTSEASPDELVGHILGRSDGQKEQPPSSSEREPLGEVVLELRKLSASRCREIDLELRAGEILGVAGEAGSGREELARLLFGLKSPTEGEILVNGRPFEAAGPAEAMSAGFAYLAGDRARLASLPTMSVRENYTLAALPDFVGGRGRWLNLKDERRKTGSMLEKFDVRPRSSERQIDMLSGGNRQKVLIAKWLAKDPVIMVLEEPTSGMDVGAKAAVHEMLREAARRGAAVLLLSGDEVELSQVCPRVVILKEGSIVARLGLGEVTREAILRAYLGSGQLEVQ